jgi:hypothetical protein
MSPFSAISRSATGCQTEAPLGHVGELVLDVGVGDLPVGLLDRDGLVREEVDLGRDLDREAEGELGVGPGRLELTFELRRVHGEQFVLLEHVLPPGVDEALGDVHGDLGAIALLEHLGGDLAAAEAGEVHALAEAAVSAGELAGDLVRGDDDGDTLGGGTLLFDSDLHDLWCF